VQGGQTPACQRIVAMLHRLEKGGLCAHVRDGVAIGALLAFEATQTDFDRSFPNGHALTAHPPHQQHHHPPHQQPQPQQQPQQPQQQQQQQQQPKRRLSLTRPAAGTHALALATPNPNPTPTPNAATLAAAPPRGKG